jgi:hypothetical protein
MLNNGSDKKRIRINTPYAVTQNTVKGSYLGGILALRKYLFLEMISNIDRILMSPMKSMIREIEKEKKRYIWGKGKLKKNNNRPCVRKERISAFPLGANATSARQSGPMEKLRPTAAPHCVHQETGSVMLKVCAVMQ